MKIHYILTGIFLISAATLSSFGQQNYKITQNMSMAGMGQNISSTVYVKGSRKRTEQGAIMGFGGDVATIEQCDLRRTLQVNDKKKLYFIEPFATEAETSAPSPRAAATPRTPPPAVTKGGTVTITTSINDTGERKQMFGLTARHIKTSMSMTPSPDACTKQGMNMQTDGWYVDLPQFSCPITVPRTPSAPRGQSERSGCEDRMIMKYSGGAGRIGFPLQLTTTIGGEGGQSYSMTVDTIDFSRATLDDLLFDIPQGYTAANSSSDLYKMSTGDMIKAAKNAGSNPVFNPSSVGQAAKRPGVKRVGVLLPTNRTSENISMGSMQSYLIGQLSSGNIEAIAVGSEAEARANSCDYLLSSDISKLKQSAAGKIGGIFGRATGVPTGGAGNYDGQIDFNLRSLSSGSSVVQDKAAAKIGGSADAATQSLLSQEASVVKASIK